MRRTHRIGIFWYYAAATALILGLLAMGGGSVGADPPGNNGTVKIHDADTHEEDRRNEPHVCEFYLAGFGFDEGQSGTWSIVGHGGSNVAGNGSKSGNWGPVGAAGTWQTGVMSLSDGHYKLTWETGQGNGKHKVFWVKCAEEQQGTPTPGPVNTPTPKPDNTPTPVPENTPTPGPQNTPTPGPQNTPTPGVDTTPTPSGQADVLGTPSAGGQPAVTGAPPTGGAAPEGANGFLALAFAALGVVMLGSGFWAYRIRNASRRG